MDFVVNLGGKPVKALRGSQDDDVRKKAVALTAQWKALVAGKLERVAARKEKETEAGETLIDAQHDTHSASTISRASKSHAAPAVHGRAATGSARVSVPLRTSGVPARPGVLSHRRGTCAAIAGVGARSQRGGGVLNREVHGMVTVRAKAERARTACACCRMYVVAAAAMMLLLTRGVDCYTPSSAPHHFFAAGASTASQQQSSSKIPAPGQLARPREGVVLKGNGKVVFYHICRPCWSPTSQMSHSGNKMQYHMAHAE